jgi:hypothetical protein
MGTSSSSGNCTANEGLALGDAEDEKLLAATDGEAE